MAQHLVRRFRSLVAWATTGRHRPARRHRRGHRRPAPPHVERAQLERARIERARAEQLLAPCAPVELVGPQPLAHPATPSLRHLGVVGLPGTVGAAARMATARAAAERRFHGADPRARLVDPRHPSMWRPEGPRA